MNVAWLHQFTRLTISSDMVALDVLWLSVVILLTVSVATLASTNDFSETQTREKMANATRILDGLKKNYDKRLRPFFGGKPITVYVDFFVVNIGEISVRNMDYRLMIYYRQTWQDPRLKFDLDHDLVIQGGMLNDIWIPDTFFTNEKTSLVHQVTKDNYMLLIMPNGTIFFSLRISITAICPMDLRKYPLDSQRCHLDVMSYSGSTKDLILKWKFGERRSVSTQKDIRLPQMDLIKLIGKEYKDQFPSGNYSRLSLTFHFKRRINLFLTETYVPLVLIVALSWVSFWINYKAAPARVALCITTVLTMITLSSAVRSSLPKVTYTKYSDIILITALLYVFAALVEYAIVNYYDNLEQQRKLKQQKINDDVELAGHTEGDYEGDEPDAQNKSYSRSLVQKVKRYLHLDEMKVDSIDMKCRFLFPVSFIFINVVFWVFFVVNSD